MGPTHSFSISMSTCKVACSGIIGLYILMFNDLHASENVRKLISDPLAGSEREN